MTAHIHAKLMKQYAEDATKTDKPWELWEYSEDGKRWIQFNTCNPSWHKGNQYRRIDPYRELKKAAADPTKQIRVRKTDDEWGEWHDNSEWKWFWTSPPEDYEIRDKPVEKKKVKMWQWIIQSHKFLNPALTGNFYRETEVYRYYEHNEVLGPALWTEIEVDEP